MRRSLQTSTRALIALARVGVALMLLALSGTFTAAAQSSPARPDRANANTPRLLVAGYSRPTNSNRAAATSVVVALQRRVARATLWVIPTRDSEQLLFDHLWDPTTAGSTRDLLTFGRVFRSPRVLDVQATTRASEVRLTGTLYRSDGDTLPVLVLTVSGASLDVAADSLASRVLRESDILEVARSNPMRMNAGARREPPPSR